jgi:hypothetical protein
MERNYAEALATVSAHSVPTSRWAWIRFNVATEQKRWSGHNGNSIVEDGDRKHAVRKIVCV